MEVDDRFRLKDLNDELLVIVCGQLEVEDLLRLARTCRRMHHVVTQQCEEVWHAQFIAAKFPLPSSAPNPETGGWRKLYQDKCTTAARERRLERRVKLLRARSTVATLQRAVAQLKEEIGREAVRRKASAIEAANLKRLQQVGAAQAVGAWVPTSVQQSWDRVASCTPVDAAARLSALQADAKASQLHTDTLRMQLRARQAELRTAQQRVAALEG